MKKTLLLFVISLCITTAFSQPVINKLYDFQPGDTYTYRKLASGETIDINSIETTGANLVWDLSALQLEETVNTDSIISYESSSWPNSFPGCSFVWKEYSGTEQYYRKNGDSLLYMGNAVWAPSVFVPNPPTMIYPGTYSASGNIYSGFQTYLNYTTLWTFEARYNAYGTLVLPGNVSVPSAALYVSYGGPANSGYSDFMWIRQDESLPLMRIQFMHSGENVTVQYCYVLVAALTGTEDDTAPEARVSIYPNPAQDMIYMESETDFIQVGLTDLNGRTIYQTNNPGSKASIPSDDLQNGIYIVKYVLKDGSTGISKIMK